MGKDCVEVLASLLFFVGDEYWVSKLRWGESSLDFAKSELFWSTSSSSSSSSSSEEEEVDGVDCCCCSRSKVVRFLLLEEVVLGLMERQI